MSDATSKQDTNRLKRRFEQCVFLIGAGLRDKDAAYEADPHRYPYSSNFRHGLSIFAELCAECAGENAATLLEGLSESSFIRSYCAADVMEWTKGWTDESRAIVQESKVGDIGPLAAVDGGFFSPTDECFELTQYVEEDTVGAYQERQVYDFLRAGTQNQYVVGRRFLIRNPILTSDDCSAFTTGRLSLSSEPLDQGEASSVDQEWFATLLDMAYEESPDNLKICPRCGWTMGKRGMQPYCSSPRCHESLAEDYEKLDLVPSGAGRLTRGVMRYICGPGSLELSIAEEAQRLGLGFELWPQKDACDVLITLPDGTRLALDAKAYGSPRRLAREIAQDKTADILAANEVIYVVPDEAEASHPGYCASCNQALSTRANYSCCTFKKLAKRLANSAKEAKR